MECGGNRPLFNDRLEHSSLRTYQTDLHQIFRVGRHAAVDVQSGIRCAIASSSADEFPVSSMHHSLLDQVKV